MRLGPLFIFAVLAGPVTARAQGAIVTGAVFDSITRAPLAGATVQLVGANTQARSASADSLGRYRITDVPDGRYTLGFFHPMLDSLLMEPVLREVVVERGRAAHADLAIPSAARLRAAICRSNADSGAVLVGTVRDARAREPVPGVVVTASWLEMSISAQGTSRRVAHLTATTGDNGWFALCNVPRGGTMGLVATRGADSTDVIEVDVPAAGFLRRELYLGAAAARLSGTVVTLEGGRPIAGAQVSIAGGPRTRTNERGEWTLAEAPGGTRTLDVRAVTYSPSRRSVDVVAGAAPVRVQLITLKAVLDTVKVTASRLRGRDITGFLERARGSGVGTFLTAERIDKMNPIVVSDVFRLVPGLQLTEARGSVNNKVTMRGAFTALGTGALPRCHPAFFLDGHYMGGDSVPGMPQSPLTMDDVDEWARPDEIAGIEVYPPGTVPPQFDTGMTGCGSIVIWRK